MEIELMEIVLHDRPHEFDFHISMRSYSLQLIPMEIELAEVIFLVTILIEINLYDLNEDQAYRYHRYQSP